MENDLYNIVVYKVIVFKIPRGDKMIKKVYHQAVYTERNIPKKDLTKKELELKQGKYYEWHYITSSHKVGEVDWYINNLNAKSESAYQQYVLNGYK